MEPDASLSSNEPTAKSSSNPSHATSNLPSSFNNLEDCHIDFSESSSSLQLSELSHDALHSTLDSAFFITSEDLPVYPEENMMYVWRTSMDQLCLINIYNIRYSLNENIIQFDFFISPGDICKVSQVKLSFDGSYLQYEPIHAVSMNYGYSLHSYYCKGIEEIIFLSDDGKYTVRRNSIKFTILMYAATK